MLFIQTVDDELAALQNEGDYRRVRCESNCHSDIGKWIYVAPETGLFYFPRRTLEIWEQEGLEYEVLLTSVHSRDELVPLIGARIPLTRKVGLQKASDIFGPDDNGVTAIPGMTIGYPHSQYMEFLLEPGHNAEEIRSGLAGIITESFGPEEQIPFVTSETTSRIKSQTLRVRGPVVALSEVLEAYEGNEALVLRIEIEALYKVIIDASLEALGLDISIIAPLWDVLGFHLIDLHGANAAVGREGQHGKSGINREAGGCGEDGEAGLPGKNGGNFYGKGAWFTGIHMLEVNTAGGEGGGGGKGGDGGNGAEGMSRIKYNKYNSKKTLTGLDGKSVERKFAGSARSQFNKYFEGYKAGRGGKGGQPGRPGISGLQILEGVDLQPNVISRELSVAGDGGFHGLKGTSYVQYYTQNYGHYDLQERSTRGWFFSRNTSINDTPPDAPESLREINVDVALAMYERYFQRHARAGKWTPPFPGLVIDDE